MVTKAPAPPAKREQHKLHTQRALQQAALELFAKRGYDDTTTEEIAERAGVSPRTFFRYFATKESVLFVGEYRWFQSFKAAHSAQPAELSDLDAMRATLLDLASGFVKSRRSLLMYEQAVASSPTLRGRVQEHQIEDIAIVAEAVARRRGLAAADEASTLFASVCQLTFRRGLTRWLAGPASDDPSDVIAGEFDELARLFAPATPAVPRRRTK